MDRKNFESILMRHGVSEVAAANACKDFDNAKSDDAKAAVVRDALKRHKIGVKEKSDNKSTAKADTKDEVKKPAPKKAKRTRRKG